MQGGFALQTNTQTQNEATENSINQIYDKILKRILTLSSGAVLNLINGLFKTNFPTDSKIVYNWTENIDDNLGKTISDTILSIYAGDECHRFHIEAEIDCADTNDTSIVLRVFEYGYRDALKHRDVNREKIILKFPEPKIILLEHNSKSPDEVVLELDFGVKGRIDFSVPTVKFLDYTVEELNTQRMVILLPLYLLKLRKQIDRSVKQDGNKVDVRHNALELKDLIDNGILKAINDNEKAGNIDSYDAYVLAGLAKKLYDHLYGSIQEFKVEGVRSMLDDMLLVEYEEELIIAKRKIAQEVAQETESKTALEIAKNLLEQGLAPENIAMATKLSIEKIKELQFQLMPA